MSEPINNVVEPKKDEKRSHTAQEFADAYQTLCNEMGFQLVVAPAYVKRDDNTFSLVLQPSVGEMPKEEKK